MTIQDLGSIGELIGSIAVVVTLVFLTIQIRKNTIEMRATNRQQLVNRGHLATLQVANNRDLADIFGKVVDGLDLTRSEQNQYAFLIRALLYDSQEAFLLHREGRLDEDYWGTRIGQINAYMAGEAAREVYRSTKPSGLLTSDFVEWLDSCLKDVDEGA